MYTKTTKLLNIKAWNQWPSYRLFLMGFVHRAVDLIVLMFVVTTTLFFLLRLTGDPAAVIAGPDANPEQLALIREAYGFDRSLPMQFLSYMAQIMQGDFGVSLATGQSALETVLYSLPATLGLAIPALVIAFIVAAPLGAWIGSGDDQWRRFAAGVIFVLQGTPGFVAGLLLIQIFAVELSILPSMGLYGPASFILPVATLVLFLMPKQTRLIAANVVEAYREDYVRTALAIGASDREVLFRHILPNALTGSIALLGAQAALLLSGAIITETIFGWPGTGSLLLQSSQTLDFPVVQAIAIIMSLLVFAANGLADLAILAIDPRIRDGADVK